MECRRCHWSSFCEAFIKLTFFNFKGCPFKLTAMEDLTCFFKDSKAFQVASPVHVRGPMLRKPDWPVAPMKASGWCHTQPVPMLLHSITPARVFAETW